MVNETTPAPAVAKLGAITISSNEVQQLLRAMPESERTKVKSNPEDLKNWLRQRLASEALLREASKGMGRTSGGQDTH
ncbi:hypothetical protein F3J24_20985 [Comamonas sp. Tr-654]|uniref:hypothetical protein n=1 Tax=Comamonas sp. Tr-654 TaxID=2608341 RepID=UPI0014238943|nr:hypothetical protein [Comamonas sp. Tr-654]NIF85958.1 hypothetical protein [Comamonas sp. Tr-654]